MSNSLTLAYLFAPQGSNSTTSALTKLTTRLNFLKERRTQIANELQTMDKGRGSGQASRGQDKGRGSESQQNLDKSQGSELQSSSQSEKGREPDSSQSLPNQEKGAGMEGQSMQNLEKSRKSNMHSTQNTDGGKSSEGSRPQTLDRGKSEGHVSYDTDKPRALGGQSQMTTRTFSR